MDSQPITTLTMPLKDRERFVSYRSIHPDDVLGAFVVVAIEVAVQTQNRGWINHFQQILRKNRVETSVLCMLDQCMENKAQTRALFRDQRLLDVFSEIANQLIAEAEENGRAGHILYELCAEALRCNSYVIQLNEPTVVNRFEASPEYLNIFVYEADDYFLFLTPKPEYAHQAWAQNEEGAPVEAAPGFDCATVLQGMVAQLPRSIEAIEDYTQIVTQRVTEICTQKTEELTQKIQSLRRASNLIKSGQASDALIQSALQTNVEGPPVVIDEEVLSQLIIVNLPDLGTSVPGQAIHQQEVPQQSMPQQTMVRDNQCKLCTNSSAPCFEYSDCGCHVCVKCLRKNSRTKFKCPVCGSYAADSSAVVNFIAEHSEMARARPNCMACDALPDEAQLCQISCGCKLCASCVADQSMSCPSCSSPLYLSLSEKERLIEEAACAKLCSKCGIRQILVCNCSCEACAIESTIYLPVTGMCSDCNVPFDPRAYKLTLGFYMCRVCNQKYGKEGTYRMPCYCQVCYRCLRQQSETGIEKCNWCKHRYREAEKVQIYSALQKVDSTIPPYKPSAEDPQPRLYSW